MPRVKRGVTTRRRHNSLLALTKGFRNGRRTLIKRAKEASLKAGQHAYRDRRNKKRDFRRSWILRINAGVREHGMTYSQFTYQAKLKGITLNRKALSELALTDPAAFKAIVEQVRG